jgi:hypothetical protein
LLSINYPKYKLKITEFGKYIFGEDGYFIEDITKLLMYYNLSSYSTGADLWKLIIKEVLFKYNENISKKVLDNEILKNTGCKIRLTGFKGTFSKDSAFGNLNVINIDEGYRLKKIELTDENKYMIAYSLVNELIKYDINRSEYTINEISEIIKWGNAYGWNSSEVQIILEKLANEGIIILNRQLSPVIVKMVIGPKKLLSKIYDLLF